MSILFIVLIAVNIAAFIIGHLVTETNYRLPLFLDCKPFNCKKCLTTHIVWVINTFIGLLIGSILYIICGIIAACITYYLIDLEEKSQWS